MTDVVPVEDALVAEGFVGTGLGLAADGLVQLVACVTTRVALCGEISVEWQRGCGHRHENDCQGDDSGFEKHVVC